MPRYQVKIKAVAYGCRFVANLDFYLAECSTGTDVIRVAEKYARDRGWQSVVVSAGVSGTIVDLPE